MKIAIIGTGYVGLVSGACFSDFGHNVVCFDKNVSKIEALNKNIIPIFEPGLDLLVARNNKAGRIIFKTNLDEGISSFDVIFIAVGTPSRRGDGHADLSSIFSLCKDLKKLLKPSQLIVIKSTVPIGTNKRVSEILNSKKKVCEVASNPEFLREGSALEDFMKPDRVILGVNSKSAETILREVYKPLYLREFPLVFTDPHSAEMIKYASNAFLATKISFLNEIATLCEKIGADIKEVSKGMGLDKRIGNKFMHAGPGYGGSCFPKDTLAFTRTGQEFGAPLEIIEKVISVNEKIKSRMVDKIKNGLDRKLAGKTAAVFGVTFKPNTDDMREATSLKIIPELLNCGMHVKVVDPQGYKEGKDLLHGVEWVEDCYEASKNTDIIIILTEWNEFRALNLRKLSGLMKTKILIDLRNIYTKDQALKEGFEKYVSIGRL